MRRNGTRFGRRSSGSRGVSGPPVDPIIALTPHTRVRADAYVAGATDTLTDMVAGRTFTQATGANKPTLSATYGPNSQPALTFPGTTNRWLDYTGAAADYDFLHATPSTVCIAYREPDDNTSYAGVHVLYATQATSVASVLGVDERLGGILSGNGSAAVWNYSVGTYSSGAYRWRANRRLAYPTANGVHTRGSSALSINSAYANAPSASSVTVPMRLFSHPGASRPLSQNAAWFESIFFDYALSDPELAIVSGYFVSRYGVTA